MRKFTSVLSLTAIVLSALFMSCAKSKTPDVVVAFPSNKYASYERDENYESNAEGAYKWVVEKKYTYDPYALNNPLSSSGGIYGGFDLSSVLSPRTINYWFEPNLDWTVEVMGIGKKYIVNSSCIFQINTLKQRLILTSFDTPLLYTLAVSKEALKSLKELYTQKR